MPRVNVGRTIRAERDLAERIAYEMEANGWNPESLARRMTDVGCKINASAIWKVINQDPPRRLTVDELVALKIVFKLESTDELLRPVAEVRGEQSLARWRQISDTWEGIADQVGDLVNAISEVLVLRVDDPSLHSDVMGLWFDNEPDADDSPPVVAQIVDDSGNVLVDDVPQLRDALKGLLATAIEVAGMAAMRTVAGPGNE